MSNFQKDALFICYIHCNKNNNTNNIKNDYATVIERMRAIEKCIGKTLYLISIDNGDSITIYFKANYETRQIVTEYSLPTKGSSPSPYRQVFGYTNKHMNTYYFTYLATNDESPKLLEIRHDYLLVSSDPNNKNLIHFRSYIMCQDAYELILDKITEFQKVKNYNYIYENLNYHDNLDGYVFRQSLSYNKKIGAIKN